MIWTFLIISFIATGLLVVLWPFAPYYCVIDKATDKTIAWNLSRWEAEDLAECDPCLAIILQNERHR